MSKFLAAGISQNKTSILETADRPDLSSLEQPTCFWATTTPRCTFQQSKHQKWKKVREWIPQSITQVSDRLCPVMLAFLATASSSVFVGKPKTGNLTSKFRLLKTCPTPKNVGQQGTLDTCYLWKLGQAFVHSWKIIGAIIWIFKYFLNILTREFLQHLVRDATHFCGSCTLSGKISCLYFYFDKNFSVQPIFWPKLLCATHILTKSFWASQILTNTSQNVTFF